MVSDQRELTPLGERYLELMKQCLTRYLVIDEEFKEPELTGWRAQLYRPLGALLAKRELRLGREGGDAAAREYGKDWPAHAETMVGMRRLANVQACIGDVIRDGVPGDLIETGVWRGGTTIFMRAVLAAYEDNERSVWVADSFRGLPMPDSARYPADQGLILTTPRLSVGLDEVKANFAKYGLLDSQVEFLVGWFKDSLPAAPIEQLAVIRLDGDLYESTIDALSTLYPKLSIGGYVIVDDYHWIEACKRAVTDYRASNGITDPVETIDWTGAFWRKTA